MDRDWLEAQLTAGRSIESIAREVGKHPSTVGHWVSKYGLVSRHAARHAAKGPPDRELVVSLVEDGLTIQQMAERLGIGATTVRYWLRRHGLTTARASGALRPSDGPGAVIRECRRHGYTTWLRSGAGDRYRCRQCRIEAVTARRRRIKRQLIDEAGGRCVLCGYDRFPGALQFHHLDPARKSFSLSQQGVARSLEKARAEAAKCVLMCANCHAEVEGGAATIRL
jgi:excisionase family DNA binding protein